MKEVSVLVGAGSIGLAIARRVGVGKITVLADYSLENVERAGTPDEVGDLAEFLMSSRGRFISGTDILIDGGTTASYWYGDLQYLKATH